MLFHLFYLVIQFYFVMDISNKSFIFTGLLNMMYVINVEVCCYLIKQ